MAKNRNSKKEKQNATSATQQGSGTQYHQEHAGHIEGYGEIDPNAENKRNM